jgi:hypothetical protein
MPKPMDNIVKDLIKESLTKYSANLDEIMDNVDQLDEIINSKEFLTTLINDLINNKRNVTEWKLMDSHNGLEDVDPFDNEKDRFEIEYSFDFKYKYQDKIIPLTLFINGDVYFSRTPYRSASHMQPAEGGEAEVDYKNLDYGLDLSLFTQDGDEVNIKWVTPDLKKRLVQQLLKDYV